jgi:hypothetical protein
MKIFIFLAFTALLFVFPQWLFRNRRFRLVYIIMAYSDKCRQFAATVMCLTLLLFHIVYFAVFPTNQGIILSSLIAFSSLATKHSARLLQFIRQSKQCTVALAVATIVFAFIPGMLSLGISLAFILEFACSYPSKHKIRRNTTVKTQDYGKQ